MEKEQLKQELIAARDAYYNSDTPIMTDEEYDTKWSQFIFNYPEDEFCNTIGTPVPEVTEWKKLKHTIPMSSLNKVNTVEEFRKWVEKMRKYEEKN